MPKYNHQTLLQHAYAALQLPGTFGYTICLHILSQYHQTNEEPQGSFQATPFNPKGMLETNIRQNIHSGIEQLTSNPSLRTAEELTTQDIWRYIPRYNLSSRIDFLRYKYLRRKGGNKKKNRDIFPAKDKLQILISCWNFTSDDTENTEPDAIAAPDGSKLNTPSSEEKHRDTLIQHIHFANRAIKQQRSLKRELLHCTSILFAAIYALGCGATIAGAMLMLIGPAGTGLAISLITGIITLWINWKNGQVRVSSAIDDLLYMPKSQHAKNTSKPWSYKLASIILILPALAQLRGFNYYSNDVTGQYQTFKQKWKVWLAFISSLAVGLTIGALTWEFSMHLAITMGFSSSALFPPLLGIIVGVTIFAEWALAIRSFMTLISWDPIKERWHNYKNLFKPSVNDTRLQKRHKQIAKWLSHIIGAIFVAICITGLVFLSLAGQKALQWSFNKMPNVINKMIILSSWIISIIHFVGSMPFNIDMSLTASHSIGQSLLFGYIEPSSSKHKQPWYARLGKICHDFLSQHHQSLIIGFILGFGLSLLLIGTGVGAVAGVPMLLILFKCLGIGLASGLIIATWAKYYHDAKHQPETNPPFFLKLFNAIGNGVVALSEGFFGIMTNGIMSLVSSFAGDAEPKSNLMLKAQKQQLQKLQPIIVAQMPLQNHDEGINHGSGGVVPAQDTQLPSTCA